MKKNSMTIIEENRLTKVCKTTKKVILSAFTMATMSCLCMTTAYAAGDVDASSFVDSAGTVLKSVIILIGAGVGVWGVVGLLEGYGNDNAGAKSP